MVDYIKSLAEAHIMGSEEQEVSDSWLARIDSGLPLAFPSGFSDDADEGSVDGDGGR